jgi:hypothetical protein
LVAHYYHDDGHRLVDQGKRAVLQLSSQNALAMQIRQLFNLQGSLQAVGYDGIAEREN